MKINEIFENDLTKNIDEVIINSTKLDFAKLINEFSFTDCVLENLLKFFSFYNSQLEYPKYNAVLISGEIETGKTYFLKMLSLLLDNSLEINNETPFNYIKKLGKINDNYLNNIEINQNISRDVIFIRSLYYKNDSFLHWLYNGFNGLLGFSNLLPHVAYFEKQLCIKNLYDDFKLEFKRINGNDWEKVRNEFYFIYQDIIDCVINIGFLNNEEAEKWFNIILENYEFSVDEFCEEINSYCENKGNKHHILFLIDDIELFYKEFIIEFQEIINILSNKCKGNVFIIATTQLTLKQIDSMLFELKIANFTNIFATELFFNYNNIIEATKLKLLSKKNVFEYELENDFNNIELFNSVYFDDFKIHKNDFVKCYPFLNYQLELFIEILKNYYNSAKSFITWGEERYNLLNYCQKVLKEFIDNEYGSIISFNLFFNVLWFVDGHNRIFYIIKENKKITEFDLEVLKVIFMLDYSDKIEATSKNITTLMIQNINENPFELNKKIDKSLERLMKENLIEKQNFYHFKNNY